MSTPIWQLSNSSGSRFSAVCTTFDGSEKYRTTVQVWNTNIITLNVMVLMIRQNSPLIKQVPKYLIMYWKIFVHVTIVFQTFESLQEKIIFRHKARSTLLLHTGVCYKASFFSAENLLISSLIVGSHFFTLSKKKLILNKLLPGSSST